MGLFSNVGEALFGTKTKSEGRKASKEAQKAAKAVSAKAGAIGDAAGQEANFYDQGAKMSTGQTAGEFMQKANEAAQGQAEQSGVAAATQGTQAALRAARSSGLSKGQAALTAGQQAGDIYSDTFNKNLETGRAQYQSMAGNIAGQGAQMAGRQQQALGTQLGAAQTMAGIGAQQTAAGQQTAANTWGTIGAIAGGAAMLSDEDAKKDIVEISPRGARVGMMVKSMMSGEQKNPDEVNVFEIAKKIRPVMYKYKQKIVEEGKAPAGEKVGVIAQDLEKTPLADVVKVGDDGLKRIDTTELTPAVLNMLVQLSQEVLRLKEGK